MEFIVVPDTPEGEAVADAVRAHPQTRTLVHPSGRPWIVGHWPDDALTLAAAGPRRIALLGPAVIDAAYLAAMLAAARCVGDLDMVSRQVPGSFHLIATLDGRVRVQGSLSTARQAFHCRTGGATVAADRPDTLAALTGARVRTELLAARLLAPSPPWPLNEMCLWHGVDALPTGSYLELTPQGQGRVVHWWTPPEPAVRLREAAPVIRTALQDAVTARTNGGGTVSADLSGDLDSASVSFLAAESAERLITVHRTGHDHDGDGTARACHAAAGLPGAEHLVIGAREFPGWFGGLSQPEPDIEAPMRGVHLRAANVALARRLAGSGSRLHLTGDGGDELFLFNPRHLHTLFRTAPMTAVRALRADRAQSHWRRAPTLRALCDGASFHRWLHGLADSLDAPPTGAGDVSFRGWGIDCRLPAWATAHAAHTVRELLTRTAAEQPPPLSPLRGRHAMLNDIRTCGDANRRLNRLTSRHGVAFETPFTDDLVVEAALAVDIADGAAPARYKPALVEAMRGIVPDTGLGRPTRSEYTAEAHAGLRRHRDELLEVCGDMRLARLGLVDPAALRSALLAPPSPPHLAPLLSTLACEVWLRSLPSAARPKVAA